jgi:NodT family efflux transporter outer membrane factor (OMF) lipoprotein
MNRKAWVFSGVLAALLSSCMVGPKYSKPTAPAAPTYSEQPPASFEESQGWKAAQPNDSAIRGKWWELYGNPQLNSLEEKAAAASQNIKLAEANFRQARAAIQFNRSALFPTISTAPEITANRLSANKPVTHYPYQYGDFVLPIDVSYEADLWGRIRHQIASSREQFQASAADLGNVRLSVQAELAFDYFELHSVDAEKQLTDNTVDAYRKALELTQNRFAGGVANKEEVAQAQTQLNTTEAQNIDLGVAREQYQHAIAVLIGQPPEGFQLAVLVLNQTPPPVPLGVPSQLLERRPDIAAAERQVAAENEQIGIAKAAYYPQLFISASGGLEGNSIVNWFNWPSRFWAVGPQMLETIFDAGRRKALSEEATAGYDASVAAYRQTALNAFQEVEDNLAALRILEQETSKQREATAAAQEALRISMNRYKGGLVTYLDVITAQTIAFSDERTEVDLLRRRMDASVLLIKALGGGWSTSQLPKA